MQRLGMMICAFGGVAAVWSPDPARPEFGRPVMAEAPADPPLRWSTTDNVRWKITLPGPGNAAPAVAGDRVFVTCELELGRRRGLLCYERDSGRLMWNAPVEYGPSASESADTPYCWAAPVTDGQVVIAWHGRAGLHAYDVSGNELWSHGPKAFELEPEAGSDPVLYKNLVILNVGPARHCTLAAFDRDTGQVQWRQTFPGPPSEQLEAFQGHWSTPVLYRAEETTLLLASLPGQLVALDPLTGRQRWTCPGLGPLVYLSPLISNGSVVALSGYWAPAIAVRPRGDGAEAGVERLWDATEPSAQRVRSATIAERHIYTLNEQGVAWCVDLETGEMRWKHRLSDKGEWSSLAHAGRRLYVTDLSGTTFVLAPDPMECNVLAENSLKERIRAPLTFAGRQVFARTYGHLYCLEASPPDG